MLRKLNDKFQENLSRSGIIDARARYRAAARWLRNTDVEILCLQMTDEYFLMFSKNLEADENTEASEGSRKLGNKHPVCLYDLYTPTWGMVLTLEQNSKLFFHKALTYSSFP